MQYYVSLPPQWSKDRTWPVVVTVAGAGKNWKENQVQFAEIRDREHYPFIIVTPIILTNGGKNPQTNPAYTYGAAVWDRVAREKSCVFDLDGVREVIGDVQRNYNGDSHAYLTGFSGGGNLTNAIVMLRPELLRGAALAAGNYNGRCTSGRTERGLFDDPTQRALSTAPERTTLPVRYFNGENDQNARFLIPQRDSAMKLERLDGFTNVSSVMVPEMGHDPMPSQVLAYFASLLPSGSQGK